MGVYKVFDGTNWVDPCTCDVRIRTSDDAWKLLEPLDCVTRYWDGSTWCLVDCGTPQISDKTEINIWFDSSGSMDSTLPALTVMRDSFLEDCLLPIYNNDINLYNTRVKIISDANERSIDQLGTERNFNTTVPQTPPWVNRPVDTTVNQVLNMVYSDEANNVYWASPFDPNVQTAQFITDVTNTRNITLEPYTVKGTMFRVNGNVGQRDFVEAQFVDNGLYTPPLNLSDLPFNYNANLDTEKGFRINVSGNQYLASNGVDWIPGTYLCPIITNSGLGAGMTVNIDAVAITGGVGTVTLTNPGAGYPPNTTQQIFVVQGGGGQGRITYQTNIAGEITSILGVAWNGQGYVAGAALLQDPAGVTIPAEINIDTLISYTRLVYTINTGIADYGNGLYVSGDAIDVAPPSPAVGTTLHPMSILVDLGTPQYYLEELVTALNQLGLVLTCP
jgi:hypothetical protein